MRRFLQKVVRVVTIATICAIGALPAVAWTGATASPPGANTSAPINVSSTAQAKTGFLNINNGYGGSSYPFSVGGVGSSWTALFNWPNTSAPAGSYGILVGSSASGYSEFENTSGYYTALADSNYGLITNGYISALNAFGAGFGMNSGSCAEANPFTGGCSCPGYAGNSAMIQSVSGQQTFVCY